MVIGLRICLSRENYFYTAFLLYYDFKYATKHALNGRKQSVATKSSLWKYTYLKTPNQQYISKYDYLTSERQQWFSIFEKVSQIPIKIKKQFAKLDVTHPRNWLD